MKQGPVFPSFLLFASVAAASFPTGLSAQLAQQAPPAAEQGQPEPAEEPEAVDQPQAEAPEAPAEAAPPAAERPLRREEALIEPQQSQPQPMARVQTPAPPQRLQYPAATGRAPAEPPMPPLETAVAEGLAGDDIPAADAPPATPLISDTSSTALADQGERGGAPWLWLLAGVLLTLGALAAWRLLRGRRATEIAVAHSADTEVAAMGAAAGAAAAAQGRPWLELLMRPVRAGVEGQDAIVEFELAVDNQGAAPARDVRVSTWMFPAGAAQESEMERLLIERPPAASLPEVVLDPGESRSIRTAVALPTGDIEDDAVLPVVVADARYFLPDGSEGRTSVSFAVGVPDGEELAHFALDRPSGLHEGVEARQLGDPERE